jgi:hypothetical protein
MFQLVSDMNIAFGNPKGDPKHIMRDLDVHLAQCKNIGAEFLELMKAFGEFAAVSIGDDYMANGVDKSLEVRAVDIDGIRDALCDIIVFALGAFHKMGIDARADMHEVVYALYSRFCTDEDHLDQTRRYYDERFVRYTIEGTFPTVCLKSAFDQLMPEYPKGKFLKAAGYRKPKLYALPAQELLTPTEDMAQQREQRMKEEADWLQYKQTVITRLQADLDGVTDEARAKFLSGNYRLEMHVARSAK